MFSRFAAVTFSVLMFQILLPLAQGQTPSPTPAPIPAPAPVPAPSQGLVIPTTLLWMGGAGIIAFFFGAVVLHVYHTSKSTSSSSVGGTSTLKPYQPGPLLATVEKVAAPLAAAPVIHDLEALAERAAAKVVNKLQTAPPTTIPNHPAASAVLDLVEESSAYKAALSQVQGILAQAQTIKPAPATPATPPA